MHKAVGLIIYCTRFLDVSGETRECRRQKEKNEELNRDANPPLYGNQVFKGHLITTCHRAAWKNNKRDLSFLLP